MGDGYGWKKIHRDVFRPVSYPIFFSALIGTGYQIVLVAFCVIIFAIVGDLYTEFVLHLVFYCITQYMLFNITRIFYISYIYILSYIIIPIKYINNSILIYTI